MTTAGELVTAALSASPGGLNVAKIHEIASLTRQVEIAAISVAVHALRRAGKIDARKDACPCCGQSVTLYSLKGLK